MEEATNWKEEPLLLDAKDLKRILRINKNHIYRLFHKESFPSLQIGKRYVIDKVTFRKWIKRESQKNDFVSKYYNLSKEEQKLYEKAFWQAVEFMEKREADNNDRRETVTELFRKAK